jgi:hypothetical protein
VLSWQQEAIDVKKLLVLLVACLLLTGCARNDESSCYWHGETDSVRISLHLIPDRDGMLPFDSAYFMWQRYDDFTSNQPMLDGGEWRDGSWSRKDNVLTLKFNDGEVMFGTYTDEGLLLDCDGGFLLNYCHLTNLNEIDSAASP